MHTKYFKISFNPEGIVFLAGRIKHIKHIGNSLLKAVILNIISNRFIIAFVTVLSESPFGWLTTDKIGSYQQSCLLLLPDLVT